MKYLPLCLFLAGCSGPFNIKDKYWAIETAVFGSVKPDPIEEHSCDQDPCPHGESFYTIKDGKAIDPSTFPR